MLFVILLSLSIYTYVLKLNSYFVTKISLTIDNIASWYNKKYYEIYTYTIIHCNYQFMCYSVSLRYKKYGLIILVCLTVV